MREKKISVGDIVFIYKFNLQVPQSPVDKRKNPDIASETTYEGQPVNNFQFGSRKGT